MKVPGPQAPVEYRIGCTSCNARFDSVDSGICPSCGDRVIVRYDQTSRISQFERDVRGMWRYRRLLPVTLDLPIVTIGEGDTPLVRSCQIGPSLGLKNLYFKLESLNPTGSFKDRIASLMVSRFSAQGVDTFLTITSGNAGSAVAAYAARAGIRCIILQLAEAPVSKGLQAHAYGASVVVLKGIHEAPENLRRAFATMLEIGNAERWPIAVMSHFYDPLNVEAYKTISFEICDELQGKAPDYVYVPVGGGGLFSASWKGFKEFHELGRISRVPRLIPVQPRGAASVAVGFNQGKNDAMEVEARTSISGVGGAYSSDGSLIIASLDETGAHCSCPSDGETHEAQSWLARAEGIFAEPAGAISVAGLISDVAKKRISRDSIAVCLITGCGFKDREVAEKLFAPATLPSIHINELNNLPAVLRDAPSHIKGVGATDPTGSSRL